MCVDVSIARSGWWVAGCEGDHGVDLGSKVDGGVHVGGVAT